MPLDHCLVCAFTPIVDSINTPISPSPSLLGTNHAATEKETGDIKTILLDVHRDLRTLDDALKDLQDIQDQLSKKRQELLAFSTEHRSAISPMRRMPAELLAEIFRHMTTITSVNDYNRVSAIQEATLPTHICRRWRDIAISIPALWSNISVRIARRDNLPSLTRAQTWISRTAGYPLSVQLVWLSQAPDKDWVSLLDIIIPHAARWRSLKIDIASDRREHHLSAIRHNIPMLDTVHISQMSEWLDIFELAPQLRRATFNINTAALPKLRLPWAQLTYCRPGRLSVAACLGMLQRCPNLVSLDANLIHEMSAILTPPVSLPYLSTLIIYAECDTTSFFLSLALPSLTEIEYYADDEDTDTTAVPFTSVLSSPIKTLTATTSHPVDVDDLAEVLKSVPNIEHLALFDFSSSVTTSRNLQTILTHTPGAQCISPMLQSLEIDYCEDDWELSDIELFLGMLESRWTPPAGTGVPISRLQSIGLRCVYVHHLHPLLLERLRALAVEGMDIKLHGRHNRLPSTL
ncbi:hypothetical protein HWV62_7716 [Athelia sp. TMB]|nr:hypothetical protein HWV62_7716 [Athelia sp. TMB]